MLGSTVTNFPRKVVLYVLGFAAYIAVPSLLVFLAARPAAAAIKDVLWPKEVDRRLAALAFWMPVALPIPVVLLIHADLTPIWTMSAVGLLPVILLASDKIVLTRNAVAAIAVIAVILPLVALIASPGVAISNQLRGNSHNAGQYKLLAQEVEKNWRAATNQPLRLLGSHHSVADTAAFYLADKPSTLNVFRPRRTPWANESRIKQEGIAVFCPTDNRPCMEKLETFARAAPASRRSEFTLTDRYLGMKGATVNYAMIAITPGQLLTSPFATN